MGQRVICFEDHSFALSGSVVNFLGEFEQVTEGDYDPQIEHSGMLKRIDSYLLPWIVASTDKPLEQVRLLEDGCGVGSTVLELRNRGLDAYGIDPGFRHARWPTEATGRLHIADGTFLPFADSSFDLVTSSGVLEHVGEGNGHFYHYQAQQAYISEIGRVLKRGGRALIAHPNGAHPLDFWHPEGHSIRLHRPYEDWMPTGSKLLKWASDSPNKLNVEFLSPTNYLGFDRIRKYRYGRMLSPIVKAYIESLDHWPRLLTTPVNPWLVTQLTKAGS